MFLYYFSKFNFGVRITGVLLYKLLEFKLYVNVDLMYRTLYTSIRINVNKDIRIEKHEEDILIFSLGNPKTCQT